MADILLIDDDPFVLKSMERLLAAEGHRVRGTTDAREGLTTLRQEPAELVIVDIHMPGMDGIEFIRELRKDFPATPVIAMSGGADFMLQDLGLEASRMLGVTVTLPKPVSLEHLREGIAGALEAGGR